MLLPENPKSALEQSNNDKQSWQQLWDVCVAYTMGRQNLIYSYRDKKYVVPEQREIIFNLLINLYRNVVARLSVAYPGIAVYPSSPSQDDILKAQASELALRYIWAEQDLSTKFQQVAEWLVTTGNAGLQTYYDPDEDDVKVKVVSPYDLFYEQYTQDEYESSWVAVRSYVNRESAKRAYPEYAEQIDKAPSATRSYSALASGEPLPDNTIEITEFYTQDREMGIVIDGEYVYKGELLKGYVPVQHIRYTHLPSILWGWGMIAPLIDLQTQYNRTRNQIIKNTELMANPKWMIPKTSGVSNNSITDKPGEKVYYNPAGGVPQVAPMPSMPPYVMESAMALQSEMMDISGVHSVSLGKRAIGISSGKAIENLASLDASQLQLTQNNIEKATRVMAKNILILMKAYYTEPKWMRMMDSTGKVVFTELSQLDIVEDPEVFIEAGTLFQSEIQDKEAKIMQMLQLGLLTPQEAREQLSTRMANRDVLEKMSNVAHSRKILEAVKRGDQVEIFADDDLGSFQMVFKEFMSNDDSYYDLPQEIRDYISDLYKNILATIKQVSASKQDPSAIPPHESIMIKNVNPVIDQNAKTMVSLDSDRARAELLGNVFEKAQKQQELNSAGLEQPEAGEKAVGLNPVTGGGMQ